MAVTSLDHQKAEHEGDNDEKRDDLLPKVAAFEQVVHNHHNNEQSQKVIGPHEKDILGHHIGLL
jgi:hypothetical protein